MSGARWAKAAPNVFVIISTEHMKKPYGPPEWLAIREVAIFRDHGQCAYCGCFPDVPHVDHIIPKSKGGSNDLSNLATSCPTCNMSKGTKPLSEWMERGRA